MKKPVQMFVATALLAGVAGCAVLTVDVDVYTGPLANSQEVQNDQVISLVMGAKPLLVQLRDHLEAEAGAPGAARGRATDLAAWGGDGVTAALDRLRSQDWYWPGYVSPGAGTERNLHNEHALMVNEVLVLYEDRTPAGVGALVSRGREAYKRYRANYDILFPQDNRRDADAWKEIKRGVEKTSAPQFVDYEPFFVSRDGLRTPPPLFATLRKQLSLPYDKPITVTRGGNTHSMSLGTKFAEFLSKLEIKVPSGKLDAIQLQREGHDPVSIKSNEDLFSVVQRVGFQVQLLAQAELVVEATVDRKKQSVTNNLKVPLVNMTVTIPTSSGEPEMLKTPTLALILKAIAEHHPAFTKLPDDSALIRQIKASDEIRQEAGRLGFKADDKGLGAKQRMIQEANRLLNAYQECDTALHELALLGLQGLQEVERANTNKEFTTQDYHYVLGAVAGFAASVISPPAVLPAEAEECLRKSKSKLKTSLLDHCAKWPRDPQTARTRLEALMKEQPGQVAKDLLMLDNWWSQQGQSLVSGRMSLSQTRLPGDLKQELLFLEQAANSALNRGRAKEGLETLIEDYLAKPSDRRNLAEKVQTKEHAKLMEGLVAFGQKVAALGNMQVLLKGGTSTAVRNHVQVLQYVGNTILVHVDELKQRAAHQDKLTRRTGWAADAVRTAGFTNQLRNNWVGSTWTNGFNAKDAIEQLTLALRTEHAHLLYQGAGPAKATAITSGTVLFSQPPTNPVVLTNLLSLGVSALTNTSSARLGTDAATAATAQPPPKPPALGELAAAEIDLSRARADEQRADLIATEKRSAHEAAHQKLQTFLKDTKREQADKDARRRLEEAKQKLAELQTHFNEWQTAWRKAAAALTNAEGQLSAATKALAESEIAFKAAIALCTNTATAYQQIEKKNSPEARQAAEAMHKATEAGKVAKARHAAAQSAEAKAKTQLEMAAKHLAAAVSKLNTAAAARNLAQKEAVERQTAANAAKQALETARKDATDLAEAAKNAAKSLSAAESEQKLTRTRRETAEARLAKAKAAALAAVQAGTQPAAADTATSFALSVTNQIIAPGPHEKLKQAIEAVTEIREDMIYLRPAAAYLRSSFPASTANRSTVGWENSLEKQTLRAIPVIGELFDAEGRAHQKILRELDKQSWQSINRVRIAGAGDVNYVVAKDDIGNWYVKSYSADPSNMVRSVKNLAMFSAGGAFGGGRLPIKVGDKQTFAFTNLVFDSQLQQAVANYTRQTTNAFIQLTNDVTGLPGKLINAWKGAGFTNDSSLTALQTAAKTNQFNAALKTPLSDANKAFQDASQDLKASVADEQTVTLLRAVVAYGAALQGDAAGLAEGDQPKAKAAISSTVLSFVTAAARGRAEIITRFEESLGVIQAGARQQSQALGQ